jgi:hypothetical protein
MKPVVLGMAQPYPGYSCEQVTIVASRILDTIVAFGQTRHYKYIYIYVLRSVCKLLECHQNEGEFFLQCSHWTPNFTHSLQTKQKPPMQIVKTQSQY